MAGGKDANLFNTPIWDVVDAFESVVGIPVISYNDSHTHSAVLGTIHQVIHHLEEEAK